MKLRSIAIENYRCFETLTLNLHPELTILIAPNGAGKTTLLDAARAALWPFVKAFDLGSQTGKAAGIQIDDVRLSIQTDGNMEPQVPSLITATGDWSTDITEKNWTQTRSSLKKSSNTLGDPQTKALTKHGKTLQQCVRDNLPVTLPLISYLGTSRLWYQGRYTSEAAETTLDKSEYSRTSGYLNCLALSSSFKAFVDWYSWIYRSYRESQLLALEKGVALDEQGQKLEAVTRLIKAAINELTAEATGWHDLEYSERYQQQLVMRHATHGVMPVEMLSDGLRNTIAMVADMAFRAYKLNPQLGLNAARETPGVVLIDEVDMFLHPAWQQTIIGSLRKAFPKVQFIVTTHSPQVLSTVKRENIRVLGVDHTGNAIAEPPLAMTYGEPSNIVLHSVMQVDPQPPVQEKQRLQLLTELVDQGDYKTPAAVQYMAELMQLLGPQHPQLQRLQRSIERQEILEGHQQHQTISGHDEATPR